jgi:nucleoside-diphosphate-sugar epimerase
MVSQGRGAVAEFNNEMNILVTGGAGYLGSILVPHLLSLGNKVTVLDTLIYGQSPLLDCCADENFEFVYGDARQESVLRPLIAKADCIIPLAALVGAPACNRDAVGAVTVNRDAVALIAKLRSAKQYVLFPTTNSGYGIGQEGVACTEETPLRPISLYGTTKVEAEQVLLDSGEAVTFRLATVFGASPRMRLDLLVNDFVYRAVNDRAVVLFEAHFKRNYIHIRDVARVFAHGIENYAAMKGRPYNVGLSNANLSKLELCEAIKKYIPEFVFSESQIGEDPDKRNYIVCNLRIEATGWSPEVSLDAGIVELKKAYRIVKQRQYGNF